MYNKNTGKISSIFYIPKNDTSERIKFIFLRFLIYVRALYCLLKLTYLAHVPKKLLEELPGFNPVEEAIEEIEATELCVRKFTDVCNSLLSGKNHLRIINPF